MSVLWDEAWLAWAACSRRGAVAARWEEQGWKEPGFPSWEVSGLLFLGGACRWDRMWQPAWKGGDWCFWQCPSERPPGSLSERILASAWGLDTVLRAVLSWRTPCSSTACGARVGGQSPSSTSPGGTALTSHTAGLQVPTSPCCRPAHHPAPGDAGGCTGSLLAPGLAEVATSGGRRSGQER